MLMAYAFVYSPPTQRAKFYEMGTYAILFYISHVITIVIVANIIFWLKDVDPRFRDGANNLPYSPLLHFYPFISPFIPSPSLPNLLLFMSVR
jgi:hypothetical protein